MDQVEPTSSNPYRLILCPRKKTFAGAGVPFRPGNPFLYAGGKTYASRNY
jgi:hypothetical protein